MRHPLEDMTERERLDRRKALEQVVLEGDMAVGFLGSEFWGVLRRTLCAKRDALKDECYDAARNPDKNIHNYLGRMEAVEWVLGVIERDFVEQRNQAVRQRMEDDEFEKQEKELNAAVKDQLDNETFPGQSPGLT